MPKVNWKTGVYQIRNLVNGKVYVGSAAKSLSKRMLSHRYYLRKGMHPNKHLQASWKKYGESVFEFEVIERCHPSLCLNREQYWIDFYRAYEKSRGYNKSPVAGSPLGFKHTEETRIKVSVALKGKPKSDEHRLKIRAAKQNISKETKEKILCTLSTAVRNICGK